MAPSPFGVFFFYFDQILYIEEGNLILLDVDVVNFQCIYQKKPIAVTNKNTYMKKVPTHLQQTPAKGTQHSK